MKSMKAKHWKTSQFCSRVEKQTLPPSFQFLKRLSNSTKQISSNRMKRLSSPVPAQAGFAVLPVRRQFRRRGAPPWTPHREHRLGRVAHLPQPAAVPAKAYPPAKIRATKSIFLHDEPLSRLNYSEPMFRLKVYFVLNLSFFSICTHSSSRRKHLMFIPYHEISKVHNVLAARCCKDIAKRSTIIRNYFWSFRQKNASVTSKNP